MATLYVVATPIGNLGDVSARAAQVLNVVPVVFAEDTRVTGKLLKAIGSTARLVSCHSNSGTAQLKRAVAMLADGDAALVTDSGTPAISDPGAELVRLARDAGHTISPLPGASAVVAALSVSGFGASKFTFLGFLPLTVGKRMRILENALKLQHTLVIFEAPHRLLKLFEALVALAPDRILCVTRELTKLHEEIFWGSPSAAQAHFVKPRGEFVVVVASDGKKGGLAV